MQKTHNVIEKLPTIPITEDTLIIKACCLIVAISNDHFIYTTLPVDSLKSIIEWLLKYLKQKQNIGVCDALQALQSLVKRNSENVLNCTEQITMLQSILVNFLQNPMAVKKPENCDSCLPNEIKLAAINTLEALLAIQIELPIGQIEIMFPVILDILFKAKLEEFGEGGYMRLITSTLNICKYLTLNYDKSLGGVYIGELIGASKAFMLYGLPDVPKMVPSKVMVSQQAIAEPQIIVNQHKGGKIPKSRKPKTLAKTKKTESANSAVEGTSKKGAENATSRFLYDFSEAIQPFNKGVTSESDFSESEQSRYKKDLQKQAKLRYAALTLIHAVAQVYNIKLKKQKSF